jgi:hypothetical protein
MNTEASNDVTLPCTAAVAGAIALNLVAFFKEEIQNIRCLNNPDTTDKAIKIVLDGRRFVIFVCDDEPLN